MLFTISLYLAQKLENYVKNKRLIEFFSSNNSFSILNGKTCAHILFIFMLLLIFYSNVLSLFCEVVAFFVYLKICNKFWCTFFDVDFKVYWSPSFAIVFHLCEESIEQLTHYCFRTSFQIMHLNSISEVDKPFFLLVLFYERSNANNSR
jgi:hypothetical protein